MGTYVGLHTQIQIGTDIRRDTETETKTGRGTTIGTEKEIKKGKETATATETEALVEAETQTETETEAIKETEIETETEKVIEAPGTCLATKGEQIALKSSRHTRNTRMNESCHARMSYATYHDKCHVCHIELRHIS